MTNTKKHLCPYCAEEIKQDALKCRHCKSDLNTNEDLNPKTNDKLNNEAESSMPQVRTIELTKKKFKARFIMSWLLFIWWLLIIMIWWSKESWWMSAFWGLLAFWWLVLYIVTRFQRWWNHD